MLYPLPPSNLMVTAGLTVPVSTVRVSLPVPWMSISATPEMASAWLPKVAVPSGLNTSEPVPLSVRLSGDGPLGVADEVAVPVGPVDPVPDVLEFAVVVEPVEGEVPEVPDVAEGSVVVPLEPEVPGVAEGSVEVPLEPEVPDVLDGVVVVDPVGLDVLELVVPDGESSTGLELAEDNKEPSTR